MFAEIIFISAEMAGNANISKRRNRNRKKRDRRLGKIKYDENGKMIDDRNTQEGKNLGFKDIVRENALFEKYYRAQNFCSDEDVDKMLQVFKTDLPASLKITGIGAQSAALLRIIEGGYFAELTEMLASEDEVVVPTHLPWYPDKLAWQLNVTRKDIQRQESGTSEKFVQADAPVSFPDTTDVHDVKDDPHPEAVQDWF